MRMTPVQVRMARAALGLSLEQLATEAALSKEAIALLEQGLDRPEAIAKLRATFEVAGIEF